MIREEERQAAKKAYDQGLTVRQVALAEDILPEDKINALLDR